ncbi:MAG: ATP-binding protein [candidate division Zixibacteria bacterium]|nr:ATP-binding protein [candidate division Zixibacteria bacterium]
MTFTGRIRLYLVLIALVPPLVILGAVWYESNAYNRRWQESEAERQVDIFSILIRQERSQLSQSLADAARQADWPQAAQNRPRSRRPIPETITGRFDFLELADTSGLVLWSASRPGLIGDSLTLPPDWRVSDSGTSAQVEIDHTGRHPALCGWIPIDSAHRLYGGTYLDHGFLTLAVSTVDGLIEMRFADDSISPDPLLSRLKPLQLFEHDGAYTVLLVGGHTAGFYLTAELSPSGRLPHFLNLYIAAIIIGLFAVVFAMALGWHLSRRAEQELDNLLAATDRVAGGDLESPVMAYDVGEFSRLADGLSDMIAKLKQSQQRLATSERLAAWQIMGRKIAHEIKNPLTPISISTDDLRRSYAENRPDFEATLKQSVITIKTEISRMTRLLDQFVSFAKMPPPLFQHIGLENVRADIEMLYRQEIGEDHLRLTGDWRAKRKLDPEQIKQLIINLIKNSREAHPRSNITVDLRDTDGMFFITVEDTGPGFSPEKLARPFEPYMSTKTDGSGLGLVICQRIAVDHGGTIEIYNRPEGGAGVRVTLPQN